jgi:hypothetical protein
LLCLFVVRTVLVPLGSMTSVGKCILFSFFVTVARKLKQYLISRLSNDGSTEINSRPEASFAESQSRLATRNSQLPTACLPLSKGRLDSVEIHILVEARGSGMTLMTPWTAHGSPQRIKYVVLTLNSQLSNDEDRWFLVVS